MKTLIITLTLLAAFLSGCSSGNAQVVKNSDKKPDSEIAGEGIDPDSISKYAQQNEAYSLPEPVWHERKLWIFAHDGIEAFYKINRRVPKSYEEYLDSGVPLLVPNDYITGKPYVKVDRINMSDSTGFTFETDGNETCKLEFVVNNDQTDEREIRSISVSESSWRDYKTSPHINDLYYSSRAKRDYFLMSFILFSISYVEEFGKAPATLAEMFENEGPLIEKSWKWVPYTFEKSTVYFEFGIDSEKTRLYFKNGRIGNAKPLKIRIKQLYSNEVPGGRDDIEGVDWWEYTSEDEIPQDVCNMNKFLSSDSFYDGYVQIMAALNG